MDRLVVPCPLALVMVWLWLNPRVFPPVTRPVAWASKGIVGATLVVLAQLWRIDRLVWMYEELTSR